MIGLKEKKSTPYKVVDLSGSTKDVDMGSRTVTGMFNSYFYIDSDMDMLVDGAASKSIAERGVGSTKGNKIKHLKDHDVTQNIARLDVLDERTVNINGKQVTGIYHESFYPESSDSNDMLIKIQNGIYDSRSIGFRYMDLELAVVNGTDREQKAWNEYLPKALNPEAALDSGFFWVVKEIMLFEGSDVAFGANELTPMLGMKSIEEKNAYALQSIEKLDRMYSLMKSGNLTDEGFYKLEIEISQLKQNILNLSNVEPSLKDTLRSHPKKDTPQKQTFNLFT